MRRRLWMFAAAVMLPCAPVVAAPLDAERCASLKAEQAQLEQARVRDDLQKGADWGKTHLSPAKLQEVKHLIEVDEQVLFRCASKSLVTLPGDEPEPAAKANPKEESKAKDEPKAKAPAKPHGAAAPKAPAPAKAAKSGREARAGTKAAAPKPKVDDAYRPPPPPPGTNPFARQLEAPAKK